MKLLVAFWFNLSICEGWKYDLKEKSIRRLVSHFTAVKKVQKWKFTLCYPILFMCHVSQPHFTESRIWLKTFAPFWTKNQTSRASIYTSIRTLWPRKASLQTGWMIAVQPLISMTGSTDSYVSGRRKNWKLGVQILLLPTMSPFSVQ